MGGAGMGIICTICREFLLPEADSPRVVVESPVVSCTVGYMNAPFDSLGNLKLGNCPSCSGEFASPNGGVKPLLLQMKEFWLPKDPSRH